jgi:hypothetical protein
MSKSYQDQWFDLKKEYAKEIGVNFYEFLCHQKYYTGFRNWVNKDPKKIELNKLMLHEEYDEKHGQKIKEK